MMKTFTKLLTVIALSLLTTGAMAQTTYYVNAANPTPGDGKSWGEAFTDLQAALDVATTSGDQIFVAKGTYKPSKIFAPGVASPGAAGPNNRYNTFQLNSGVAIYGGYDDQGNGTKDILTNETVLSGDLGTANDNTDNAYNVVMIVAGTTGVVLDGFTIADGYANGGAQSRTVNGVTHYPYYGGGIYFRNSDGIFRNLKLLRNGARTNSSSVYGGGFFLSTTSTNLVELDNIEFIQNEANSASGAAHGGALYLAGTNLKLNRLKFINNIAKSAGGAIFASLAATNIKLGNSVFSGNSAGTNGGAIYITDNGANIMTLDVVNSTFYNNTATTSGAAVYLVNNSRVTATISNVIILGNTATTSDPDIYKGENTNFNLTNSITQGTAGTNVNTTATAADVFLSTTYGNADFLKLKPTTDNPAIDGGDENKYDAGVYGNIDLAGATRTSGAIDMGAYKNELPLPIKLSNFSAKANGSSVMVSWATETETNNSHFILEKSTDDVNFVEIANVPSKGNGAKYSYTDFSPTSGNNYYKLTQIDNDGTRVSYDPVVVNFSLKASAVSVYPNPVTGSTVTLNFNGENYDKITVYNTVGQLIKSQSIAAGATSTVLDVTSLNKGVYFIGLSKAGKTITQKLIKN